MFTLNIITTVVLKIEFHKLNSNLNEHFFMHDIVQTWKMTMICFLLLATWMNSSFALYFILRFMYVVQLLWRTATPICKEHSSLKQKEIKTTEQE